MPALHPWHEVSPGLRLPQVVNCVIEIPQGSRAKYEIDKESGLLRLDRVLYSSVSYPINYGIIPQTLFEDGDPLDILLFCHEPVESLALAEARLIGLMRMRDTGVADDKIIGVVTQDPNVNHLTHISQVPPHRLAEIKNFFETYKRLEGRTVEVGGFEGPEAAFASLQKSLEAYQRAFPRS